MTPTTTTNQRQMADRSVRFLAGYLLVTAALTFYIVFALWSAGPRVTTGQLPVPACGAGTSPALTHIYPARVDVGSAGDVWLLGCGFTNAMAVKFNAAQHAALFLDTSHIRVGLAAADVATPGTIVIGLSNGGTEVGSGPLECGITRGVVGRLRSRPVDR